MGALRQAFENSWNNKFNPTAVDLQKAVQTWDATGIQYKTVRKPFDDAQRSRKYAARSISNWVYVTLFTNAYTHFDREAKAYLSNAKLYKSLIGPVGYDWDTLEFVFAFTDPDDADEYNVGPWFGARKRLLAILDGGSC